MNEQKETTEGKEQAGAASNNDTGGESQTESFLKKLEELKQVDKSLGEKLKEFREIQSATLLGSSAGIRKEEITKQETPKEYADRVIKGLIK